MNTKKFIKIGRLFDFAKARLEKKVSRGDMKYYTANDVIDNAIKIRKYLDNHPKGLKIPTQTKEERRTMIRKSRMNCYYKKGY